MSRDARRRVLRTGVVVAGVLALFACTTDLEELDPFPCANDGTCPGAFSCVPGVGCTKSPLAYAPFACPTAGTCPAGLACIGASCTRPSMDTLCNDTNKVDCKVGGPELSCSYGFCSTSCSDSSECGSGHRCDNGRCYPECTTKSCPAGLSCQNTYRGFKLCLGGGAKYSACKEVKAESCTETTTTFTCPDWAVRCSDGHTCPRGTTCSGSGCGGCQSGYEETYCDGTPCSGGCNDRAWACKKGESTASKPDCNSAPTKFAGTCSCWNGSSISFSCGSSTSCEELCKAAATSNKESP